ncbi:MAG: hypothetical protein ACI85E_000212 [Marinomonas primoryensis]|jgi:hypothetical protein
MKISIQVSINDEHGQTYLEEIAHFEKGILKDDLVGLSLVESKQVLNKLQTAIVQHQAHAYTRKHRCCPECQKPRRIKGSTTIQHRTLFGIISIPNQRVYHCACHPGKSLTLSVLRAWLPEHNSPELQYIEAKWASLMSYGLTVDLLKDVLPINDALNADTVRKHLHKVAERQDEKLQKTPSLVSSCAHECRQLQKPDKPLTVGIDGGYVKNCCDKKNHFEVIVGKCFSKTKTGKRLGFVQTLEENPKRRLMELLNRQGMQANQQITFLSDGGDTVRELQYIMHPEAEHILDWFHITMRLTVLNQFAKGLKQSDPEEGSRITKDLDSAKWYLWHGNVKKAVDKIDYCYCILDDESLHYANRLKFQKTVEDMLRYIDNNQHLIPNYGEKYRYGETITTAFVESTVNEVVAKRMVKKQQLQWSQRGAHYLLQTRTAVLNEELREQFEQWYPGMKADRKASESAMDMPIAA